MKEGSSIIKKTKWAIKYPKSILFKSLYFLAPILPDKLYLKLLFRSWMGYKLDLKNPKTYNEKLQWLKLYYQNPVLPRMVDKYAYKEIVKQRFGNEYVPETYGLWSSFDEIDFDSLPDKFVLKTTHDQGGVILCRGKASFDRNKAKKKINRHLKNKLYIKLREWPYKFVKPRIMAEELLEQADGSEPDDYKFLCFNGQPKAFFVATDRVRGTVKFDFYDLDLNPLEITQGLGIQSFRPFKKPGNYDLMVALAEKIAEGFPHVRIDFYEVNDKVYFGEFTLFNASGIKPFHPPKWDSILGSWIDLPPASHERSS